MPTSLAKRSLAVGLIAVGFPVVGARASAEPPPPDGSEGERDEFVIAFDGTDTTAALQAVADAGGQVLDVNEAVDIALVAGGEDFSAAISEATEILAVARNHSIGTAALCGFGDVRIGFRAGRRAVGPVRRRGRGPRRRRRWLDGRLGRGRARLP
ncbi:hypothetical protein BH18ACT2_BH18ACT2_00670 [soil metagenome]